MRRHEQHLLGQEPSGLPRNGIAAWRSLILFILDETNYLRELAPLAGFYPALRLGAPWWFYDSLNGMSRYLEQDIETAAPTTVREHFFIANELTRLGVRFTSLAPRFIGRFEKGVDYIGDLAALDAEMAKHAAITAYFGSHKLSLHSGSDKFSVYPLLVKHWGERIHVKTAGTSYLEALRTLADVELALFECIWKLGLERYPTDRATYHVSAEVDKIPTKGSFLALLEDFLARKILHVTYGSALAQYQDEIKATLIEHADVFQANLQRHFRKHLSLLELR